MTPDGTLSYYQRIIQCENIIQAFRAALQAKDATKMAHAFETLMALVRPILLRRAAQLQDLGPDVVEEVYQEMVDRLLDHLFRPTYVSLETQFGAYLQSMPSRIVQKVRARYRPTHVSSLIRLDQSATEDGPPLAEIIADPQADAEMGQLIDQLTIEAALATLPAPEQVVIRQRMAGLDNQEIAQALGVSPSTATRLYQRALARLRLSLTPNDFEPRQ